MRLFSHIVFLVQDWARFLIVIKDDKIRKKFDKIKKIFIFRKIQKLYDNAEEMGTFCPCWFSLSFLRRKMGKNFCCFLFRFTP